MKWLALILVFTVVPAWAAKHQHQPCVITYSVIERDTLGNVVQV
jgi:hypothetical protein